MKKYANSHGRYASESMAGFPVHLFAVEYSEDIPMHRHHELELITARSGEINVHFMTDSVRLSQGQLLLINSGVLHGIDCAAGVCAYIMLSDEIIAPTGSTVSMKYVKPFLMNTGYPYVLLDGSLLWHRDVFSLGERIGALLQNGMSMNYFPRSESVCPELEVQSCCAELWRILYSKLVAATHSSVSGNEYAVRRRTQMMTDFIRQNYRSDITLGDIAASANISKSEASRCFQSCLNVSPVSYLLHYRAEMAAHLLRDSTMTIEAISYECGFGSASYFCKMFRRYSGMTPGEYRKGAREEKS